MIPKKTFYELVTQNKTFLMCVFLLFVLDSSSKKAAL